MKVLTWNINGIRASKRSLKDVLDELDADIICLQETKITRDMMDEPSAIVEGYNAYFSFSRKRSGYSGTANFCRDSATPTGAEEGLSGQLTSQSEGGIGCHSNTEEFEEEELRSLDGEGRAVLTQHQIELGDGGVREVVIINVYVPRAAERDERLTYKLRFLALLQARAESLLRLGKHVIVLGDINTTHKRIDHCDPSCQEYLRADSRKWVDQFLWPEDRDPDLAAVDEMNEALVSGAEGGHFIDAFRFFHRQQTEAYTNWSTVTAARQTNYGKRLDYIFVDRGLSGFLKDCRILADFEGSDHCPVVVELDCPVVRSSRCPPLCTRHMPEFSGRQQKLLRFFSSSSARSAAAAATVPATLASGKTSRHQSGDSSSISVPEEEDRGGGNRAGAADKGEQKCRVLLAASSSSLTLSSSSTSSSTLSLSQRQQPPLCGRGEKSPLKVAVKRSSSSSFHVSQGDKPPTTPTKKKRTGEGKGERGRGGGGRGVEGAGVRKQGSLLSFFRKAAVAAPPPTPSTTTTTLNPSTPPPPPSSTTTRSGSEGATTTTTTTTTNSSSSPSPSKLWLSSLTLIPEKTTTTMTMKDETRKGQTSEPSRHSPAARPTENVSSDGGGAGQEEQGHTTTTTTTTRGKSAQGRMTPRQEQPETYGPGTEPPPAPPTTNPQVKAKCAWRSLLSGPPPAPPCKGHREPCVLRTVKKAGPTKGRQFYVCARPEGLSTNKEARCEHFQWLNYMAAGGKKGQT